MAENENKISKVIKTIPSIMLHHWLAKLMTVGKNSINILLQTKGIFALNCMRIADPSDLPREQFKNSFFR